MSASRSAHAFWSTAGFLWSLLTLLFLSPPIQGFWLFLSSLDSLARLAFVSPSDAGGALGVKEI